MKLKDEMYVIIYSKSEISNYIKTLENNNNKISICNKEIINDACIETNKSNENKLININKASKEELITITGIGESKAIDIINYRETNGLFKKIEDIMEVSGIGESLFTKIKSFITIE